MSDTLGTCIRAILQATPVDALGTITAKDVRAKLLADGTVDEAWVKANKKALNALIAGIFEEVSAPLVPVQPQQSAVGADDTPPKEQDYEYSNGGPYSEREGTESQTGDYVDEDDGTEGGPSAPPAKARKKKSAKSKREITDAELARQLSTQLNGRSRSSRSGKVPPMRISKPKKGVSRTPKRNKKSAERVDDSDGGASNSEDDSNSGSDGSDGRRIAKSAKKRKTGKSTGVEGGGRAKGGFSKEFILSEPLSALLEVDRLSRPQVVKQLWVYIKGNDLQNPNNRKEILCDDRLRPVFNADKIDMFKMNKVLGQHLHEVE